MANDTNVTWHEHSVSRDEREQLNGHKGCVIWFTGLSACGKSTVANLVDHKLHKRGLHSFVLDGDNVRHGLNAGPGMLKERHGEEFAKRFGLGFSAQDREENIRRIGAVAKLFCDAGLVTLTAFISPYRRDRDAVRATMKDGDFIEIFVDAPIEVCETARSQGPVQEGPRRRAQGLHRHRRSLRGPAKPELVLDAGTEERRDAGRRSDRLPARSGKIR